MLLVILPMLAHYFVLNVSEIHSKCISKTPAENTFLIHRCIFFAVQVDNEIPETDTHHSRSQIDTFEDFGSLRAIDLKSRIEEMLRIKVNP